MGRVKAGKSKKRLSASMIAGFAYITAHARTRNACLAKSAARRIAIAVKTPDQAATAAHPPRKRFDGVSIWIQNT